MAKYVPTTNRRLNAVLIVVLIYLCFWTAWCMYRGFSKTLCPTLAVVGSVVTYAIVATRREFTQRTSHLVSLAGSRTGETICEFVGAFDARAVDPWVMRAVYEELQAWVEHVCPTLPIRASDTLRGDLFLDDDDLDELAVMIAQRSQRSLDAATPDPDRPRIHTVGDLVRFCNALPFQRKAS